MTAAGAVCALLFVVGIIALIWALRDDAWRAAPRAPNRPHEPEPEPGVSTKEEP